VKTVSPTSSGWRNEIWALREQAGNRDISDSITIAGVLLYSTATRQAVGCTQPSTQLEPLGSGGSLSVKPLERAPDHSIHLYLVLRGRMVELCCHSPIRLQIAVLILVPSEERYVFAALKYTRVSLVLPPGPWCHNNLLLRMKRHSGHSVAWYSTTERVWRHFDAV
jgi:hypothetical protein